MNKGLEKGKGYLYACILRPLLSLKYLGTSTTIMSVAMGRRYYYFVPVAWNLAPSAF